jgi:tryptophan-rich sensory protein
MIMKNLNPLKTGLAIAICFVFAYGGSIFTPVPGSEWYYHILNRPSWNPPDWLFMPVWTVLFIMMGTAMGLVASKEGAAREQVRSAWIVFVGQLVLNLAWSAAFFGLHSPALAMGVIVLLWAAIVATMLQFRAVVPLAAKLLIPYLAWVSFAGFLNFIIWQMN